MLAEHERDLLLDTLPGMAYRCSVKPPWHMEYVSPGIRLLCSYTPSDLTSGKIVWGQIVHPEDRDYVARDVEEAVSAQNQFTLTYRIIDPASGVRWVMERGDAVYDDTGNPSALVGFIADITNQKHVEQKLEQAEGRYALAARATGDIIWDWDLDNGTIDRTVSGTALGYPNAAFKAGIEWWAEQVHPEDSERVMAGVRRIVEKGGDRWADEYRLRRADGSYAYILDRGFLVRGESESARRMVGAMQDLSERKEAEEKIKGLQSELLQIAQMSAMGAMASTLAHELNQPLAACANYLTGTRRLLTSLEGDQKPQAEIGLSEAEQQIHRAGSIIRSIRALIEKQRPKGEPVSLRQVISRVVTLASVNDKCTDVVIRQKISAKADTVFVDPTQIEQVLVNLVRNGCEAMAGGESRDLLISVRELAAFAEIQVRDRGQGLAAGAIPTLFSAFPKSTTGGLGVGLSISRTIVEAHGGKIWAENNVDGGASFYFTVPLLRSAEFDLEQRYEQS